MKKYRIIILVSLLYALIGCAPEPVSEVVPDEIIVEEENNEDETPPSDTEYIYNEIIIQYKEGISEVEKAAVRARHEVVSYKQCDCADVRLELWKFDTGQQVEELEDDSILEIERRRAQAKADPGLEGTDFNFLVNMTDYWNNQILTDRIPEDKIVAENRGVTIAILDTGLDYEYEGFTRPFIYNGMSNGSSRTIMGYTDTSGWDLVNQDNNPQDDNGHGTMITYLITSSLENRGIYDYQILPVKVADREGKATFFDLLCGFKYALSKPDVTIINLSLGWYGESSYFFEDFIEEASEKNILIVTSAGNGSSDNDETPHYPSSYTNENVISVAGMDRNLRKLATYSNYGRESVDFAAPSENIPFEINGTSYSISGTSFASAYATANVAALRSVGILPENITYYMMLEGVFSDMLRDKIKTSTYVPNYPAPDIE